LGDRLTPELLPGTLYLLILRTLVAGSLHGYAIAKRVKEASREGISIEDGSLYPALNRMLVKGCSRPSGARRKTIARRVSTA
jgi:PadR family transcriptional regulator